MGEECFRFLELMNGRNNFTINVDRLASQSGVLDIFPENDMIIRLRAFHDDEELKAFRKYLYRISETRRKSSNMHVREWDH